MQPIVRKQSTLTNKRFKVCMIAHISTETAQDSLFTTLLALNHTPTHSLQINIPSYVQLDDSYLF